MAGKSEFEEGTVKFSVRLPLSIAQWYERLGGTLGKGIIEAHGILTVGDKPVEGEESKHARAESVTPPPLASNEVLVREDGRIPTLRALPRVYQGGEDVTPRFKTGKTKGEDSRARPPRDSQIPEHGEDDAQALPDYDF